MPEAALRFILFLEGGSKKAPDFLEVRPARVSLEVGPPSVDGMFQAGDSEQMKRCR